MLRDAMDMSPLPHLVFQLKGLPQHECKSCPWRKLCRLCLPREFSCHHNQNLTSRLFSTHLWHIPLPILTTCSPVLVVAFKDVSFSVPCLFYFKYCLELFVCFYLKVSAKPFRFYEIAYPCANLI